PISGFAGFLDKSFRKHDFELGRKNCQAFLRYYFSVEKDKIEQRLGTTVTKEALDRFSYSDPPKDITGNFYFPIIPDMKVAKAFNTSFDSSSYGKGADIPFPEYPSFSMKNFEKENKKLLQKRVRGIVNGFSGSWLLSLGFRAFFQRKVYRQIIKTIEGSLKDAGLLKQ